MIKVGITGGIGSGKSTVCNIFRILNIPIYNADFEAKELSNNHPQIVKNVKLLFGQDIYINNQLDRKRVGALVFNDKELLSKLNAIIHPVVAEHYAQWLAEHSDYDYVIKESAILFESKADKTVNKIITVTAPLQLRIERVVKRDSLTHEQVQQRINNQLPEEEKIKLSHYVINCNDVDLVIPQVVKLHNELMNL